MIFFFILKVTLLATPTQLELSGRIVQWSEYAHYKSKAKGSVLWYVL